MIDVVVTGLLIAAVAWPWWRLCRRDPAIPVVVIVGLIVFSSHVFALLYRLGVPADLVRGLLPVKDALALMTVLALWHRVGRAALSRPILVAAGAVVASIGVGMLMSLGEGDLWSVIRGARGLLIPVAALLVGLALDDAQRRRAFAGSAIVISGGAVVALVEWWLPISVMTEYVAVGDYWRDVKEVPQFLINHPIGALPGNTFVDAWDPESARRLAGPFGDALSAGYVIAVGIAMAVGSTRGRRLAILVTPMIVALPLTYTRAGWLMVCLPAAMLLIGTSLRAGNLSDGRWALARRPRPRRPRPAPRHVGPPRDPVSPLSVEPAPAARDGRIARRAPLVRATVMLLAVAVAAVIVAGPIGGYLRSVLAGRHGGTLAHLEYLAGLDDLPFSLWGLGLSQAGAVFGLSTENAIATSLLQLGILPGLLYWAATVVLIICAVPRWESRWVWTGYVLAVLVSLMVSEQWLTFNSGWPMALLLAAGVRITPDRQSSDTVKSPATASVYASEPNRDRA